MGFCYFHETSVAALDPALLPGAGAAAACGSRGCLGQAAVEQVAHEPRSVRTGAGGALKLVKEALPQSLVTFSFHHFACRQGPQPSSQYLTRHRIRATHIMSQESTP
ncbi:hypothetical protein VTK73DRAFT_2239 [Phialemonium thermophilum]|uniref:Uncharacterized protein n=1 Tax=Phialemonium thermophilum TaxID=223376 RepID=A0ABR3VSL2_9PEZI